MAADLVLESDVGVEHLVVAVLEQEEVLVHCTTHTDHKHHLHEQSSPNTPLPCCPIQLFQLKHSVIRKHLCHEQKDGPAEELAKGQLMGNWRTGR